MTDFRGPVSEFLNTISKYKRFKNFLCLSASASANLIDQAIKELLEIPIGSIDTRKAQEAELILRRLTYEWYAETFSANPDDVLRDLTRALEAARVPKISFSSEVTVEGYDVDGYVLSLEDLSRFGILLNRHHTSRKIGMAYLIVRGQELVLEEKSYRVSA